jgi:hypothetical protein
MVRKIRKTSLLLLATIAALCALSLDVFAQCAMCKSTLAGSGDAAAANGMNLAIVVLLVPPVAIFVGIFALGYKYRNSFRD